MRRTLLGLVRLGAIVALVFGAVEVVGRDAAHAATAVTINSAPTCSGTTFCYTPSTVTVPSGDTVTWTNESGGAPHTITRCDPSVCGGTDGGTGTDPTFDVSVGANNGDTANHTFNGTGTYNYYCKVHGFAIMHGTVTVQGQAGPTTTAAQTPPTTSGPTAATTTTSTTTAPTTPAAAPAAAVAGQVNFTG
jgi:plastocyanin